MLGFEANEWGEAMFDQHDKHDAAKHIWPVWMARMIALGSARDRGACCSLNRSVVPSIGLFCEEKIVSRRDIKIITSHFAVPF